MRYLLCCIGLFLGISAAYPQVEIRVTDSTGVGMPSAHVLYGQQGARKAVLTNAQGQVVVPAEAGSTVFLEVRYVGYQTVRDTVAQGALRTYVLQPEKSVLNEVVVTAQYAPESPDKAVNRIRIIDRAKIDAMAAVNLRDALTNEMNIRLEQDPVLGSGMSMQGLSGENVKILIDGVPVIGRLNGNIDLSQINLDNVERIEVVEGPLSVQYGTSALAGTINIITKNPANEPWNAGATVYAEQIGTLNTTGRVGARFGNHRVQLSGGRNYFDGWNEGEPTLPEAEQPADDTRFQSWKPREQYFGALQYQYNHKRWTLGYRADVFDEVIINRGLPRRPYGETAFDDYYHTQRLDHSISASGPLSARWNMRAIAAFNRYDRTKDTYLKDLTTLEEQLMQRDGDQNDTRFDQWMSRSSFFVTLTEQLQAEIGYDINYETGQGTRFEDGTVVFQGDYALFATAEWKPTRSVTIKPGVRGSYNTAYPAPVIPSLSARWETGKYAFRASYARGFRAPSLKDLYFYFVDINHNIRGNPDLEAESSHSYQASVKRSALTGQTLWQSEVSGFFNDLSDRILLALSDPANQEYTYVNIAHMQTWGINASQSLMWQHLKGTIGGGLIAQSNTDEVREAGGQDYNQSYEIRGNVTYSWKRQHTSFALFYKYQGEQVGFFVDNENNLTETNIAGYHWADISATRNFLEGRVALSLGVKNLLDIRQVDATQTGGAHGGGGGSIPIGMGRFGFVKCVFQLQPTP